MAPKKKGNKRADDDWEAELGESIAPTNTTEDPTADGADENGEDGEDAPSGGLMAMMRKNRERRKKKGIVDDFVEGENAPGAEDGEAAAPAPAAPVEASMDDEFPIPEKKGKGGKQQGGKQGGKQGGNNNKGAAAKGGDDDDDEAGDGRMLTKAEKEKLKKEREKQRKKEQVGLLHTLAVVRVTRRMSHGIRCYFADISSALSF